MSSAGPPCEPPESMLVLRASAAVRTCKILSIRAGGLGLPRALPNIKREGAGGGRGSWHTSADEHARLFPSTVADGGPMPSWKKMSVEEVRLAKRWSVDGEMA